MITSSLVVERVADNLKDRNLSFFQDSSSGIVSQIKQKIKGTQIQPEPARVLLDALMNGTITVTAPRDTELIEVSMTRKEDEEAKDIVNAFIRAYLDVGVKKEKT